MLYTNLIAEEDNTEWDESKKETYIKNIYFFNRLSDRNWCRKVSDEYREGLDNFERKIKIRYNYLSQGCQEFEDGEYALNLTIPHFFFEKMIGNVNMVIPKIDDREADNYKIEEKTEIEISKTNLCQELEKIHNFMHANKLAFHKLPYKIRELRIERIYENKRV